MRVGGADRSKLPGPLSSFSRRDLVWLWNYLMLLGFPLNPNLAGNEESMVSEISFIGPNLGGEIISRIQMDINKYVLSNKDVRFISDADARLKSWLFVRLSGFHGFNFKREWLNACLKEGDILLAAIDCDARSLSEKIRVLENLRAEWYENLELDPFYKWIDVNDDDLGFWLLDEAKKAKLPDQVFGKINDPISSKERVVKFKCLMDCSSFPFEVKKAFIGKLKARWRSKGRGKSKKRVQSNVLVLPETKSRINVLKDKYGLKSGGEVIDKLVNEALYET